MRSIRNCNVAVVGGAGFLGSHLVNHLVEDRGCEVLVIDNLVAGQGKFVHPKARFEHHDIILSEEYLRHLFFNVKYVFNYAAYPYIPDSFARPKQVCNVNFFGAINVINAAQEAGVEGILQVSSAEIYGGDVIRDNSTGEIEPGDKLSEHAEVQPHSSYGASKAAVDFYVQAAWRERQTPCIALRQFNAYGPNETHDYVIPTIISQIHRNNGSLKLGNNSSRDFQWCGDAVQSAVLLLEKGEFGGVYNMGSEESIKIYDLAALIGKLMGYEKVVIEQDPARIRPWEIWSLCSDNSKLDLTIGKSQRVSLEQGLLTTIQSYREAGCRWVFEGAS